MSRIRISRLLFGSLFAAAMLSQEIADPAALAQRAAQFQQTGNYAQAAETYRSLLKLLPDDVATHVNLGVVLVKLGQYDQAISQYAAANRLLPGDPRIALNTALAYQKSGRLEAAQKRFEDLHTAHPQDNQVTMLLADSYLQSGDNQRVIELLQPLRDSEDLGVAYMLGMALLRTQRLDEAQIILDRILKNGDTAAARLLLATRMFESGDYPAAVKELASAIALNPDLPQMQTLYGRALLNTGDPDGAAAAFARAVNSNPNDYEANIGLGQILIVRKHYSEAMVRLRHALAVRPASAEAKLLWAECLAGTQQFKDARPFAEAAAREMAKSADAHETLSSVYSGLGLPAAAARERKLALALEQARAAADPGPAPNTPAPDFSLPDTTTGRSVHLSDFRDKTPVVLVFGSYSCPNFRESAEALKSLQQRYRKRVPFFLVYIREAHDTRQWQSTRNSRDAIALTPAANFAEKENHAAMCSRTLHLPFPALVDGMDGAVETAYNAWPSRAFIIRKDGRVAYNTRLNELDFHAETMESVLRQLTSRVPEDSNAIH